MTYNFAKKLKRAALGCDIDAAIASVNPRPPFLGTVKKPSNKKRQAAK